MAQNSIYTNKAGAYFEWLLLPLLFFASLWLILPNESDEPWLWILGSILLIATPILLHRSKKHWPASGKPYYISSKDALSDAFFLFSPVVLGVALAGGVELQLSSDRVLGSLLVYPIYALLQLSIFLVIPATRMIKLGFSSNTICIISALIFSLAHFPNPLLMVFTGLAMLVFCYQFLKGRSILVLALVMGIAASGFRATIPYEWSWDMRIGPDYMEKRALSNEK
ncbi:MAG: hypothetical protein ACI9H8_001471 [Lysobacterales bacterium]|jgi:hypothetical protein